MDMLNDNDSFFENDPFLDTGTLVIEPDGKKTHTVQSIPSNHERSKEPLPEFNHLIDYLTYTRQQKASDLHISAMAQPFMRRFGCIEMIDRPPMMPEETEGILFEILSEEQKHYLLENGSLEFCLVVPEQGRYRVSLIKQRLGWDGAFRVISDTIPTFEELNMPESVRRLTEYQQGLVLVTGPANSGKTTTMAVLLDMINSNRSDHIITIERPIEYVHTPKQCQVNQREVHIHTESFAVALRAALRQDPDILMVGELNDLETLSMAISASETGHLVFGSLHTTSAARTVNKVLDGFPVNQQAQIRTMLSESLRGIVSQQLVPKKGGQGVALAMEVLFVTSGIGALLRDNRAYQIPAIMQTSRSMGMCLMDDALMDLVNNDVIDGTMAYRYADNRENFERFKEEKPVSNRATPVPVPAGKRNNGWDN